MNEYGKLVKLHSYFKKAVNTKITEQTLRSKLKLAEDLIKILEIRFIENLEKIPQEEANLLIIKAKKYYTDIVNIIKQKLLKLQQNNRQKTTISCCGVAKNKSSNMARPEGNVAFDIKQATALVQPYDGTAAGFDAFIDSVTFLKDFVQPNNMALAVRFIKTRLSGKARSGFPDDIDTIDALIGHIKTKCKDTTTPDIIVAKLNSTKQRGQITNFCEEIEDLCNKLENCYIMQDVPENVAKKMTTKAGVTALINGINASETKLILKAGNFASIKEALQKAQECASDASTSQIFNVRNKQHNQRQNQRSDYRGNGFRGNGFNRNRNFRRNGFNSRPHQNYNQPQRGRYQRGGYNNRGRFNDNRSRYDNSNRVYMANVEQPSAPQHQCNHGQANRAATQNQQHPQQNFLGQC